MTFNLPDYHVINAIDLPSGGRRVIVQADTVADGCPDCGVVSDRVHAWCRQRVKDIPHAGDVELIVVKPRLVCVERACSRRTFTQVTPELPFRARCTSRLRQCLLEAVIDHGRPVAAVAASFNVAWWTVQATVNGAIDTLPAIDDLHVTQPGVDEHRYRRVRWFRDPDTGIWQRIEPWMTTIVNTRCGQVLGVIDGLSSRGRTRPDQVLATDDPTGELGAAWGAKEALRLTLASPTLEAAQAAKAQFDTWVTAADTDETDRFAATITAWWHAIEVTIATGVTNARTEAANTTTKHIKRTGRGYRNNEHYQTRILLRSAHRARQHRLTSQGTTVKRE